MTFAKRFILDVLVLNTLLQFILQLALDVDKLKMLSIYVLNFNISHHISSNIVHGQVHVILCSTYLLNNKNFNTCFLTICSYIVKPPPAL